MMKTNAMRTLERAGISYELRRYRLDDDADLAGQVAQALGVAPEMIFKTLLVLADDAPAFALIPAPTVLDLRQCAAALRARRAELAPLRRVYELTGYERGSVTPLAARKPFPVVIDETATLWPVIGISGGAPGCEVLLAPDDLIRLLVARTADIAR
ncbi:MAG: Cys-tRNA(Pro) deacylase [Chloroflexi bacterium]|nr:Cys-tRNA(Pro) deacylase [Chloroflexota bacterium]